MAANSTGAPVVSFVVPCYKLAHLLPECIQSILSQTYQDFEILVLDDCSPDNTPEVVRSFADPRVRHYRNEPNLGHLRNYNKGIGLARGRYIWLISADDFLSRHDVLDDYVRTMDAHPHVGYACASGFELTDDGVSRTAAYSKLSPEDCIFKGKELLGELLGGNAILASSGMVRKTCYERLGAFPLDLPYAGDWYLWCLFALHYDVAYFAREALTYRIHASSMTESLLGRDAAVCVADDLKVLWRINGHARELGLGTVIRDCRRALGAYYARHLVSRSYRSASFHLTERDFQESVREFAADETEAASVLFHANAAAADRVYFGGGWREARRYTARALRLRPWTAKLWLKAFLLFLGPGGRYLRGVATRGFSH